MAKINVNCQCQQAFWLTLYLLQKPLQFHQQSKPQK